jgi:hypothetical protein
VCVWVCGVCVWCVFMCVCVGVCVCVWVCGVGVWCVFMCVCVWVCGVGVWCGCVVGVCVRARARLQVSTIHGYPQDVKGRQKPKL